MRLEAISYKDLCDDGIVRRRAVDRLCGAAKDIGFFELTDLDRQIPRSMLERHFALGEEVFALPEDVLKRYEDVDDQHQQGYTPFGLEFGDPRAYWMTGRGEPWYKPNLFPDDVLPTYGRSSIALFKGFDVVLTCVASALEDALGLQPRELTRRLEGGDDRLRHLYYKVGPNGGQAATPHGDINAQTGLFPREPGLRVRPRNGELTPVEVRPGHMIVDTGEQLSTLMRTYFGIDLPFTEHDVVMEPGARIRQSAAYFDHFSDGTIVDKETGATSRQLRCERLSQIGHQKA